MEDDLARKQKKMMSFAALCPNRELAIQNLGSHTEKDISPICGKPHTKKLRYLANRKET